MDTSAGGDTPNKASTMTNAGINAGNNHASSTKLQSRIEIAKKIVVEIIKEITDRNKKIKPRNSYYHHVGDNSDSDNDSDDSDEEYICTEGIDAFVSSLPYYIPLNKAHASPNMELRCPCRKFKSIKISDWSEGHRIDENVIFGEGCTSKSFTYPAGFKDHLRYYAEKTDKCYLHKAVLAYFNYLSLESKDTDTISDLSTNCITNLNIPKGTRETDTLLSATAQFPLRIEKKNNFLCYIYFVNARTDNDTSLSVNHDGKNCWEDGTDNAKRAIASFKCLSIWLEGIQRKGAQSPQIRNQTEYITEYVFTIRISTCILFFLISNTSLQRCTSRSKRFRKTTNRCGYQPLPQQ